MRLLFPLILLLITPTTLHAQSQAGGTNGSPLVTQPRGSNMISCAEYESIEFNGHTLEQINNTNGNYAQLWGEPDSVDHHEGVGKSFYYGENSIGFNSNGYTSGMTIIDSQLSIRVMNKEIKVGDSFSELMEKFGNDLKIIHKPVLGPEYTVSFNCNGNDYNGVHINFNPVSHKVEEIRYYVNT